MSEREGFSWAARGRSFGYAFRGVAVLVSTQHNARIHAVATLAVVALGWALGVSHRDWALLLLAIALVWAAEALNTAIEWIGDVVSPQHDPRVGRAKDVAAAGVLLAAAGAAAVGALVFVPHLLRLL